MTSGSPKRSTNSSRSRRYSVREDVVHHRPVRDGVVEATCGGFVVREVRVTEGDPVRRCNVVGEDVEFTVRVEEVALRYAKELPKGSNGSLSANLTEKKGMDWVEVDVFALGKDGKASTFARGEVREGHIGVVSEG